MPFGIAAGVAAIGGAYMQNKAAGDAADAAQDATNASLAEQRAAREWLERNNQPFIGAGTGALGVIGQLNSGDFSAFKEAPDYRFRFDQGMQGLDRSAAARGVLNAGGTDADRIAYGQGMASQAYNDFYNKQFNLAAMGQNAVAGQGSAMQNTANNIGNLLAGNAAAQGNAAIGGANAWSNALGGLAGLAGQYAGGRQSAYGSQPSLAGNGLAGGYSSLGGYGDIFGPSPRGNNFGGGYGG